MDTGHRILEEFRPVLHRVSLSGTVTSRYRKSMQTSVEISFLGSPKDSIFYSMARFFYQNAILWQIASRAQNRLQIIWISIETHATLQWIPIWRP